MNWGRHTPPTWFTTAFLLFGGSNLPHRTADMEEPDNVPNRSADSSNDEEENVCSDSDLQCRASPLVCDSSTRLDTSLLSCTNRVHRNRQGTAEHTGTTLPCACFGSRRICRGTACQYIHLFFAGSLLRDENVRNQFYPFCKSFQEGCEGLSLYIPELMMALHSQESVTCSCMPPLLNMFCPGTSRASDN